MWEQQLDQLRERLIRSCCALSAARHAAVPMENTSTQALTFDYYNLLMMQEVWEQQLDQLRERLIHSCCALSAARRAAVPGLVHLVQSALAELSMGGARFDVQVAWTLDPEVGAAAVCVCVCVCV